MAKRRQRDARGEAWRAQRANESNGMGEAKRDAAHAAMAARAERASQSKAERHAEVRHERFFKTHLLSVVREGFHRHTSRTRWRPRRGPS